MKLVRIVHFRCAEYDCKSYVLAPDDWDDQRVWAEVDEAQAAYLEQVEQARASDAGPPDPGYQPRFNDNMDKTVSEVIAEHQQARAARDAWKREQDKTRRAFEEFLTDRGFAAFWSDDAGAIEVECDWGHRHRQPLKYGDDKTDPLPTPAVMAGKPPITDPFD